MVPFSRATYSDQVVSFVKAAIRRGELRPGDPVREVALAERLGISRAPIREALQVLQQEGLITSVPQKGKTVRLISPTEIYQSFAVLGILEAAAAASWLPGMAGPTIDKLRDVVERMHAKAQIATGLADMADLDEAFHDTLLSGVENRQLAYMASTHCSALLKYLLFRQWDTAFTPLEFYVRHRLVYEALLTLDPMRVELAIRNHYEELGTIMSSQSRGREQQKSNAPSADAGLYR